MKKEEIKEKKEKAKKVGTDKTIEPEDEASDYGEYLKIKRQKKE